MIQAKIEHTFPFDKRMLQVKNSMQNKFIRIAMNKGAAITKEHAVHLAPSRLGLLKKSIRIKIKHYRASFVWLAVVGPSSKFKRMKKGKEIKTTKYAGVIERKTHFLQNAANQTHSIFVSTMEHKLEQQIQTILGSGA